ncbi:MAG: hypothetical protein M0P34_09010 [Desulfocurvus sp.]|nr:hypothetical protein [Desulfocurvus sp.]
MRTIATTRATLALCAWMLAALLAAAQARADAVEPFCGRGLVFSSDGTLYFEAEEGGVYLLEGENLADHEGSLVRITGTLSDSLHAMPVLFVDTLVEEQGGTTDDAPRPETEPGEQ